MTKTRIIVCASSGRMGKVVCALAAQDPCMEVVAGVDVFASEGGLTYPVYESIGAVNIDADAIIDFNRPTATQEALAIIKYSINRKVPLVLCTTGLPAEVTTSLKDASKHVAVLQSPNMSLGVNLLANMLDRASRLLYNANFDIEIIEKHHNQKLDAPSGTALMLANTINDSLGGHMKIVNDRSKTHALRERDEIGVHALRGGSIVGEHNIVFAGLDEVIEFTHIAQSRDAFAVGALNAAKFLHGKPAGFYTMQDLINEI